MLFRLMKKRVENRKSVMRRIGIRDEYRILPEGRR